MNSSSGSKSDNSTINIVLGIIIVHLSLLPPNLLRSVCLSVCLSVRRITEKSCERILTKFLAGVGHGPRNNEFNFGDYTDHRPDPGVRSPISLDYRFRLCWRTAEVCAL